MKLFAISVDSPDSSKELAVKIATDGHGEINFPILSDPDHRTIDAFRLHDPAYDNQQLAGIPHPAVYVIDKNGMIAWAKIESDYKQRPTIDQIRVAIDAVK